MKKNSRTRMKATMKRQQSYNNENNNGTTIKNNNLKITKHKNEKATIVQQWKQWKNKIRKTMKKE